MVSRSDDEITDERIQRSLDGMLEHARNNLPQGYQFAVLVFPRDLSGTKCIHYASTANESDFHDVLMAFVKQQVH